MDFIAASDAPVVRIIDGQEVSFPVWTLAEVADLAGRIAARRLEQAREACKLADLEPLDAATYLGQVQIGSPTPWDVARYFDTLSGAKECLEHSLKRSGYSDVAAAAIVARLYPQQLIELSRLVGRIVQPPLPAGATNPPADTAPAKTG